MADRVPEIAAWVFLVGVLLMAASPVPQVKRLVPRPLLVGFGLAVGSFALVAAAAVW